MPEELESIELLRYAVKLFDGCNESFNQQYPAEDLIKLARVMRKCQWDITPDEWSQSQILRAITLGEVPEWEQGRLGNYVPKRRLSNRKA